MIDLLNTQWADALANALLHSLWQGAVIVILVRALSASGVLATAKERYMANFIGMCTLFVACVTGFLLGLQTGTPEYTIINETFVPLATSSENAGSGSGINIQELALMIWILGVIIMSLKHGLELFRLHQLKADSHRAPKQWQRRTEELMREYAIRGKVLLVSTSRATVPFTMGILKPIIVMPAVYFTQLSPDQLEAIIRHELAHIRRFDFAYNLVQVVIESLMFFNPAAWMLGNEIRRQREFSCDDMVTASPQLKKDYLEALYAAATIHAATNPGAVALFDNQSELIMRVQRICNSKRASRRSPISFATTAGAVLVLCAIFMHSFGAQAAPEIEPELVLEELSEFTSDADMEALATWARNEIAMDYMLALEVSKMEIDTHPPSPRMVELERQMEELSDELEELADQIEETVEEGMEEEMEQIEELAEEMERLAEQYEEQMEESMEQELERIEELSEMMEARAEQMEERAEELDEERIAEIERKMAATESRYAKYGELTEEQRAELNEEMRKLSEEMQEEMRGLQEEVAKLHQDQEFIALQEEMNQISSQIAQSQQEMNPMHEQMRVLQEQMAKQQSEINSQIHDGIEELHNEMQDLQRELESLHLEYMEEVKKWEKEHKPKGDN